jgi:hypothetical protein
MIYVDLRLINTICMIYCVVCIIMGVSAKGADTLLHRHLRGAQHNSHIAHVIYAEYCIFMLVCIAKCVMYVLRHVYAVGSVTGA